MPKILGVSLPKVFLVTAALIAIACGIALRASHTTDRPLHTDEAVQAWQTWQLLQGEGYRYDPVDMHGPTLYHGAAWWTRLTGGSAATFDDFRARSFSLLAGALTLLLFWRWTSMNLGVGAALAVALLLAMMPLAVVYSTYFIQEPWLALGSWALLFAAMRWWREPTFATAVACGILAGFVQATKETSVIHFAAIVIALFALGGPRPIARQFLAHGAAAFAAAAVVFVAFYSGFGAHPGGIIDGLLTYKHQFARAGDGAFEQPFFHYFAMLLPHRTGGVMWGETGLFVCAVAGFVLALRRGAPAPVRAVAVFTLVLLLIYSAIPHKMPWILLTPALGLATLAGFALSRLASVSRWGIAASIALAAAVAIELGFRSERALGRFAGDVRNPYFLEQTPRGFTKLTAELDRIFSAEPGARVAVVSPNHAWPLPWYLRDRETVGYYQVPPADPAAWDVRILDSQLEAPASWNDDAVVGIHGLRPNVVLTLSVSEPLWERVHP
ncbi:MAG TPA: flippase activity-associated protein Agl23 [Opitutaceae bacterium]|nr:flippase activity-associated protein Agl23 [Opitutaceae bacterium]